MRYVGIDPSSKTGLVIIDKQGNIINTQDVTTKVKEDPQRFSDIAEKIIDELQPNDLIAIEGFSYGSKGKGVSFQYGLGWIIRHLLLERGYEYTEVPPTSVKKFATGKGTPRKMKWCFLSIKSGDLNTPLITCEMPLCWLKWQRGYMTQAILQNTKKKP
jgi:crossover junction endodeoxyribonuclease RuvC